MAQIPATLDRRCPRCHRAPAQQHVVGSLPEIQAAVANLLRGAPFADLDLGPCERCRAWTDVPRAFTATVGVGRWFVASVVRAVAAEAGWQWRHGIPHRVRVAVARPPTTRLVPPQVLRWHSGEQPGTPVRTLRPGSIDVDRVNDSSAADQHEPEGDEDAERVVPSPEWRQLTRRLRERGWLPPQAWQRRVVPPDDRPSHHTQGNLPRRHPTEGDDALPPMAPSPRPPGDLGQWQPHDRRPLAWGPQPLDPPARSPDLERLGEVVLRWGQHADDEDRATRDAGPEAPRPSPYDTDVEREARRQWFERLHQALHGDPPESADAELPPAVGVDAPPSRTKSRIPPDPVGGQVPEVAGPRPEGPGDDPGGAPVADPAPGSVPGPSAADVRAAKRAARDAHPSRYRPLDD